MALLESNNDCLTCDQQAGAGSLSIQNEENCNISDVLRKHFWFTEVDFHQATICQICWDLVNQFHQLYVSVQELHHSRLISIIVKSEPAIAEDDCPSRSESTDSNLNQQQKGLTKEKLVDGDESILPSSDGEEENHQHHSEQGQNITRQHTLTKRGYKPQKQCQMEDEYIRKHVKYICKLCGKDSTSFVQYGKHCLHAHGQKSFFVECCGKKYYHKGSLYQHVQVVNMPTLFRCEQCRKNFKNRNGYRWHMKELHSTEEERKFKCDRCPRTFAVDSLCKRHIKRHVEKESSEQRQRYPCTQCSHSFCNSRLLRDHIAAIHNGISPYKCPFCAMTFNSNANMHRHKKTMHANEWREMLNSR